jgi:hypothetical protein
MLKSILLLGVGFSLGYAKALHDSGDIKEVLETFRNDEELKTAFKDLTEALKRVRESDDKPANKPPEPGTPEAHTPPTIT